MKEKNMAIGYLREGIQICLDQEGRARLISF